jgi:hypothetical protein
MNIFDLIFENPLFIAAIIGIMTSIFRRMNSTNDEKKTVPKQPRQKKPTIQKDVSQPTQAVVKPIEKRYQEVTNRKKVQPLNSKILASHLEQTTKKRKHSKRNDKPSLNSPIEGIIWSEILREPRSKRPFRPSIRK